jgi:hypothetical protein
MYRMGASWLSLPISRAWAFSSLRRLASARLRAFSALRSSLRSADAREVRFVAMFFSTFARLAAAFAESAAALAAALSSRSAAEIAIRREESLVALLTFSHAFAALARAPVAFWSAAAILVRWSAAVFCRRAISLRNCSDLAIFLVSARHVWRLYACG